MKSSGDKQYSTMTYREWLIGMALAGGKHTSLGAVREANRVLELLDEEAAEAEELALKEKYPHQEVANSIVTRPPPEEWKEDYLAPSPEAEAQINEALRASEPTEDIRLPKQVDAFPLPRVHETSTDSALSMWRWECPHCYVRLAVGQTDEGKKMLVKFMNEHSDCETRVYEGTPE